MNNTNNSATETTILSELSYGDWMQAQNRWMRGIDWCVSRTGRKWSTHFPEMKLGMFRTKKAAYDAVTSVILAEGRNRAGR
jgi:hypothetical protein